MSDLPPLYACRLCGTEVEPNDPQVYRRVSGWVQNRKPAHVVLVTGEIGFACWLCVEGKKLLGDTGQESLF